MIGLKVKALRDLKHTENRFESWTANNIYECISEKYIISIRNNSGMYTQFEKSFFKSEMIGKYFEIIQ